MKKKAPTLPPKKKNPRMGSSLDDFLKEHGIYETVTASAQKRVLAYQLDQARKAKHISKADLARRLNTSRMQVDRLLDGDNPGVTLDTLTRAASAVGMQLRCELVEA